MMYIAERIFKCHPARQVKLTKDELLLSVYDSNIVYLYLYYIL